MTKYFGILRPMINRHKNVKKHGLILFTIQFQEPNYQTLGPRSLPQVYIRLYYKWLEFLAFTLKI